jgi:hypothetical protein
MTQARDAVSYPMDQLPVRPGTSAALTARTIDATVHPPLVRAQEKVAEMIPRLAAPLESPLLLISLAGTLVFVWMARRSKLRLAGVLLPAAMFVTLTSFRPAASEDPVSPAAPTSENAPFIFDAPETPEPPQPPQPPQHWVRRSPSRDRSFADQLVASFPELMIVARVNAELLVQKVNEDLRDRDEREIRQYVKELRRRLRAEARRVARDR